MGFVNRGSGRWPNGEIPIVTEGGFSEFAHAKQALQGAIQEYADNTAITIRPARRNLDGFIDEVIVLITDQHWARFFNLWKCYTWSGGRNYFAQFINCPIFGNYLFGTNLQRILVHEFGHVMGLYHEHQRPDRDQYVREKAWNFFASDYGLIIEPDALPLGAYNCTSIMH